MYLALTSKCYMYIGTVDNIQLISNLHLNILK